MNKKRKSRSELVRQGITLNHLMDQRQSLNARMLLAMQQHNENELDRLTRKLAEVQEDIDCILPPPLLK